MILVKMNLNLINLSYKWFNRQINRKKTDKNPKKLKVNKDLLFSDFMLTGILDT